MTALESTQTLYSREQIKIPEAFPDIIKDYTKHIIRTKPNNILYASAEYFKNLARQRQKEALSVTIEQLESLFAMLSPSPSYNITKHVLDDSCESAKLNRTHIDDLIKLGSWENSETVDWFHFWCLCCTMSAGTLLSTVELACNVMSNNGLVSMEYCSKMIRYLGLIDPDVDKDEVESCITLLGDNRGTSLASGVVDIVKSSISRGL